MVVSDSVMKTDDVVDVNIYLHQKFVPEGTEMDGFNEGSRDVSSEMIQVVCDTKRLLVEPLISPSIRTIESLSAIPSLAKISPTQLPLSLFTPFLTRHSVSLSRLWISRNRWNIFHVLKKFLNLRMLN
jgi:hypothetical protein